MKGWWALIVVGLCGFSSYALELGSPFTEQVVLQRDVPLPIWGWAEAGKKVTVSLNDQRLVSSVDANGRWQVAFPPQRAGGPFTLVAKSRSR